MGYTHYYSNKRAFTNSEWVALTKDVKELLKNCSVPLAGGNGTLGSRPTFNSQEISFNGVEEDSHETAYVSKDASEFEFCKTAQKPYDSVVVEFFKLIRKYDPNVELSSDGGDEVFAENRVDEDDSTKYNDKIDADDRIATEEKIAAHLFDNYNLTEEEAADASRQVLKIALMTFRTDLFCSP